MSDDGSGTDANAVVKAPSGLFGIDGRVDGADSARQRNPVLEKQAVRKAESILESDDPKDVLKPNVPLGGSTTVSVAGEPNPG
jgi:hypothetical protein